MITPFYRRAALLAGLIVSIVPVVPRAETISGFSTFGDSAAPLDERQIRDRLTSLGSLLAMDGEVTDFDRDQAAATGSGAMSAPQGLPPEVLARLKPAYESSIAKIQEQIARLKPDDHAGREMLTSTLQRTVQNYTKMFGAPPLGVSAAPTATPTPVVATTPAMPRLKRSVTGDRTLSLPQAITSLRNMLELNSTAAARAAFAAGPEYKNARQCATAAAGAVAVNRVTAALAAWLRAHELEPKNPTHLFNLAGLTARVGMPRHTLALLDAAETLGRPTSGFVTTARATALTNRGHALVQLKRFGEAETVLREALRLAPGLSEARINLAHALYQQDDSRKKEEARQLMRFARWRKAQPPASNSTASTGSPATTPTGTPSGTADPSSDARDAEFNAERKGRLPASAVFDLSRGKPGGLPTIKIPRTIGDGHAMYSKILKLQKDIEARTTGIVQRMIELDAIMRRREQSGAMSVASANRARDVFWYISNTQSEPEFRGLWREIELASSDRGIGLTGGQYDNPWASKELYDTHYRIRTTIKGDWDAHCQAMWDATVPFQASWQGPIRRMETAINRYYHVTYPHMTALAANLGDSVHHEYAMLLIEQKGLGLMHYILGPLHTVGFFDWGCVESWGLRGEPGQAEEPGPGQFTVADRCGALSKDGFKAVFDLEVVELSINCEKVGAELSAGEWMKLFGEVECTYDGEVTIFMGGAVEAEIPFIGIVETGSKAGGYVTIDFEKGIVDVGVKSTESIKVGIGPIGIEREVEHAYVIASFGGG